MPTKNNPNGNKVNVGVLVEPELFEKFDQAIKSRCLQKSSVLRKLISDFAESGQFQTEKN